MEGPYGIPPGSPLILPPYNNFVTHAFNRIAQSPLGIENASFLGANGTAYFLYLGRTAQLLTPKFVEVFVSTAGAGAQTAELGLFSTPSPPNKAAQTLTKLVATGTVDSLVSTGIKRNTNAFLIPIPAGTFLYAGVRTAMATTEPTFHALSRDYAQGFTLFTAAAGALTNAGPWAGAIVPAASGAIVPEMRATLD